MPNEGHLPHMAKGASTDQAPLRMPRIGAGARYAVIAVIVLAAIAGAGRWSYWQWAHVSETDARIQADTIAISSRVAGWVVDLPIIQGDRIKHGELLVKIDSRESRLKLTEYGARIAALAAEREQITSQIDLIDRTTASRVEAARSRADAARVAVEASREQFELARMNFERTRTLLAEEIVSRQRLDQARNELSRAQERHEKAQADLAAALADVGEAEAARGEINVLASRMEALRHGEAEVVAQRDQQALDAADRTIKSPIDGVVSETFVDRGEFVSPGQRLMLVHNPELVWVEANIKETDIRHLAPGMPVDIVIDAFPDRTFTGTVARIGQAATSEFALLPNPNPSGNFTKVTQRLPVRITIEETRGVLRPGMMAVVNIAIPGR